jgi:hypothetical protein
MRWFRDAMVVAGLIILRVGLPLAITVGIGKLVHHLLRRPNEGVPSVPPRRGSWQRIRDQPRFSGLELSSRLPARQERAWVPIRHRDGC